MMLDASEFKKGETVANYGDFICVTCILVLALWKILNCIWGISYAEHVTHANNRKVVSCNIL